MSVSPNISLSQQPICDKPVFVVGSPRSGTTVMALSLIQHSHFWASAESYFLKYIIDERELSKLFPGGDQQIFGNHWLREQHVDKPEFLNYLGLGLNALYTSRSQGKRWLDATPDYTNIMDAIASLFPGALFIHVLRDGRRVVNSLINFKQSQSGWIGKFDAACDTWNHAVTTAMDFASNYPSRCIVVRNEEVTSSSGRLFDQILEFLGAPYEEGPANYWRTNRINSSFDRGSTERSMGPQEIWETWTNEQQRIFLERAGETLALYGLASVDEVNAMESDAGIVTSEDSLSRRLLASRVREAVSELLPDGAHVLVVSKGDSSLLYLQGKTARYFPQASDGGYAGGYPDDSEQAIAHLENRHSEGAEYLLFPSTAFWWFDSYPGFRQHLEERYRTLVRNDSCVILALQEPATGQAPTTLIEGK